HPVELRLGEQRIEPVAREHVLLEEVEGVRRFEMRDVAAAPEMQVVDAPHLVAELDQAVAQVAADEAGAAGYERAHGAVAVIAAIIVGLEPGVRTGSRAPRGRSSGDRSRRSRSGPTPRRSSTRPCGATDCPA